MTQRELFLITGIPGTGKTSLGHWLANDCGFLHFDFEHSETLSRFASGPNRFVEELLKSNVSIVITWGFYPNEAQIDAVRAVKSSGFKLFWFDGNRVAALRMFQKRGTVSEELLNQQIDRIENSKVIDKIQPVNPFDRTENFKDLRTLLDEMRQA